MRLLLGGLAALATTATLVHAASEPSAVASGAVRPAPALTAVPPARYPGGLSKAQVPAELLAPVLAASRVIDLGAPTQPELEPIGRVYRDPRARGPAGSAGEGRRVGPLQVGVGRDVDPAAAVIDGASLGWQDRSDGGRVARIEVRSGGAAALRLRIEVRNAASGIELRFAGSAGKPVFGSFAAAALTRGAEFWTPVLEGERAIVEIRAPDGASARAMTLAIPQISHLAVAGAALKTFRAKREAEIGASDNCHVDVACIAPAPSQALLDAASAVAHMLVTDSGRTVMCTGTMLNDSINSFRPYLTTAHHCVRTQRGANSINTYWFFEAATCNSLAVPPYVLLVGGARLLAASNDYDWTLLELREMPPAGVVYSAWRAEPVPVGATVSTLHHPAGDLKKFSQGTAQGYSRVYDFNADGTLAGGGDFLNVQWSLGATQGGSSGAGLFTFLPQAGGGFYELRGTLFGGDAFCSTPDGVDYFSRFDTALPLTREYLTPDVGYPQGVGPVVEFYNPNLDHFFITADPLEIAVLDAGDRFPGWVRTGFRFLAYTDPAFAPADATPVCRFYLRPEVGDSHFYSASPSECAQVQQRFGASWVYESASVFWIQLPSLNGLCPAGTTPVYRFYRPYEINHRFTIEASLRDDMIYFGDIQEGYGNPPDQVAMCSPNG